MRPFAERAGSYRYPHWAVTAGSPGDENDALASARHPRTLWNNSRIAWPQGPSAIAHRPPRQSDATAIPRHSRPAKTAMTSIAGTRLGRHGRGPRGKGRFPRGRSAWRTIRNRREGRKGRGGAWFGRAGRGQGTVRLAGRGGVDFPNLGNFWQQRQRGRAETRGGGVGGSGQARSGTSGSRGRVGEGTIMTSLRVEVSHPKQPTA